MSEGFSTTSASGSTYPPAAMESHPAEFGVNTGGNGAGNSTTGAAKEQAGQVAQTAKQAGSEVVGTVKEQAGAVTAEATHQARALLDQTRNEITDQASTQQQRVAGGLHSLADEIQGMLDGQPKAGLAKDFAQTASDKAHEVADWIGQRDPGTLLAEVRDYARRRPGAFLAISLGAGILAGRLTKGLTASNSGDQQSGRTEQSGVNGGHGYPGTAVSGYGQDDALLTAGDVPAVRAIPPVEGYGTSGGTRGDLTR